MTLSLGMGLWRFTVVMIPFVENVFVALLFSALPKRNKVVEEKEKLQLLGRPAMMFEVEAR